MPWNERLTRLGEIKASKRVRLNLPQTITAKQYLRSSCDSCFNSESRDLRLDFYVRYGSTPLECPTSLGLSYGIRTWPGRPPTMNRTSTISLRLDYAMAFFMLLGETKLHDDDDDDDV